MESTEIVILYSQELFASGIRRLLEERGLSVEAVDVHSKYILRLVRSMRPRLVLIEDDDDHIFTSKLNGILKGSRDIKVIRISSQNNRLSIYSSKQIWATGPQDLYDAIDNLVLQNGEQLSAPSRASKVPSAAPVLGQIAGKVASAAEAGGD